MNNITKWYIHKLESVLENQTNKILWNSEMQADHSIPARIADLLFISEKKRTFPLMDFAVPADHTVKMKESEMIENSLITKKKLWNIRVTVIPIIVGVL